MMALFTLIALVLSAINLSGSVGMTGKRGLTAIGQENYPVRGEINQTYQLAPNANIDVTGIEGAVEVDGVAEYRAYVERDFGVSAFARVKLHRGEEGGLENATQCGVAPEVRSGVVRARIEAPSA